MIPVETKLPEFGEPDTYLARWEGITAVVPASIEAFDKQLKAIGKAQTPCALVMLPQPHVPSNFEGLSLEHDKKESYAIVICRRLGGKMEVCIDGELLNMVIKKERDRANTAGTTSFDRHLANLYVKYCSNDVALKQTIQKIVEALEKRTPRPDLVTGFSKELQPEIDQLVKTYFLKLAHGQSQRYMIECMYTVALWLDTPCPKAWHPEHNPDVKPCHLSDDE